MGQFTIRVNGKEHTYYGMYEEGMRRSLREMVIKAKERNNAGWLLNQLKRYSNPDKHKELNPPVLTQGELF